MVYSVLKFEVKCRLSSPLTYVFFLLVLIISFLSVTTNLNIAGEIGTLKENSPIILTYIMVVLSAFFMVITSAIMGTPMLRDIHHNTESLMYINPISKFDLLAGRFLGSLLVVILVISGMLIGLIIGEFVPFRDTLKLLPFNLLSYLSIFGIFIIPNLFFSGAIFFFIGSISKKNILVFTQGILLLVLYLLLLQLSVNLNAENIAAFLDPFGIITFQVYTKYWTVPEQNIQLIPLEGLILYNRILWTIIGVVCLLLTYFNWSSIPYRSKKQGKLKEDIKYVDVSESTKKVIATNPDNSVVKTILLQAWFHLKAILKDSSFLSIVISGFAVLVYSFLNQSSLYGVKPYPVTSLILEVIDNFDLFIIAIIILFSGDLIWKERESKLNLLTDFIPNSYSNELLSKLIALISMGVVILLSLVFIGILTQSVQGYLKFDLSQYFEKLFFEKLCVIILFSVLSISIQALTLNRYLGYFVTLFLVLFFNLMPSIGIERLIFQFGKVDLGLYSDMNGFSEPKSKVLVYFLFWLSCVFILFLVTLKRGNKAKSKNQISWSFIILTSLIPFFLGILIYYNTDLLNKFHSEEELELSKFHYERELKKYENFPQPKIVKSHINVDIHPSVRSFYANGFYILKNETNTTIKKVFIQLNTAPNLILDELTFSKEFSKTINSGEHGFLGYELRTKLSPGDTLRMDFKVSYQSKGFSANTENFDLLENGSLFYNDYFPLIGYNNKYELDSDRVKYGLSPKEYRLSRLDPIALTNNMYSDDANLLELDLIISTDFEQKAIAPGKLIREWREKERSFFHYQSKRPIINFFGIASARYNVLFDSVQLGDDLIRLEIFYHDGHQVNLKRIITAMKNSLKYCSEEFGPYQFDFLRVVESPGYNSLAQSFSGTIFLSERLGFQLNVKETDLDVITATIAHEVSHQWWGHQVTPANAYGQSLLTETLAQYTAMMILRRQFSESHLRQFLKYDINSYFLGRANEKYGEEAINNVISKRYLSYNKGVLIMYALQDYMGENYVNESLRKFLNDWSFKVDKYPTSDDLTLYFEKGIPEKIKYIIEDMFKKVTIYENRAISMNIQKINDTSYTTTLLVDAKKIIDEGFGKMRDASMNDLIDIGLFDQNGQTIYLQKHNITQGINTIEISTNRAPTSMGIDPFYKLLDRNIDDNTFVILE